LILIVALAVVLWGTMAPIGYEAVTGGRISIGTPFFNRFFVPLGLVLAIALAVLPLLNWKRTKAEALRPASISLLIAGVFAVLIWFVLHPTSVVVATAVGLGAWVVISHGADLYKRLRKGTTLPMAYVGMTLAHVGFSLCMIGIAITATQSEESDVRMAPQGSVMLAGQRVTFLGVVEAQGPNYSAQQGVFLVEPESTGSYELRAEKRRYFAGNNVMTEAGIQAGLLADTYVSLGEPLADGAWAVRLHYKPLVRWVWLGALLMALGGIIAIFDRRYRSLRVRDTKVIGAVAQS
jgi:cytochrome c-type biogenesis protein CcmF